MNDERRSPKQLEEEACALARYLDERQMVNADVLAVVAVTTGLAIKNITANEDEARKALAMVQNRMQEAAGVGGVEGSLQ